MTLHIRGVSKTYDNGVQALKDVTLTIPAGMFGLLGPNGSGKSTLMRTIATLQEPDQGAIRLGDIDVLRQKGEVRKTLAFFTPFCSPLFPSVFVRSAAFLCSVSLCVSPSSGSSELRMKAPRGLDPRLQGFPELSKLLTRLASLVGSTPRCSIVLGRSWTEVGMTLSTRDPGRILLSLPAKVVRTCHKPNPSSVLVS
jgi:ABC-type branched-subunit amino acid transport system ATPase component